MASTPPLLPTQPSGVMSSLLTGRITRYILLTLAFFFSLWLWRQSSQSAPQVPFAFIPAKLYEPGVACTDNLADQPRPVSR